MEGYTFKKLNKTRHNGVIDNVDNIKKLLFCVTGKSSGENNTIGINMETGALYHNVNIILMGSEEPTKNLGKDEIEMIRNILLKYNVKEWEQFYKDPNNEHIMDGFGWSLALEGDNMTVQKHTGCGATKKLVTPEDFDEFEKNILALL